MPRLKITISGDATELLIGTFPKEGADWIVAYCKEFEPYTDIEEVWYGEGLIPEEWAKGKDSSDFDNIFHEFGFTFSDRNETKWFLDGNLVGRPKIKGIYVNGKSVKYNLSKIPRTYTKINLPHLNRNEIFVCHGQVYKVSIDYFVDTIGHFYANNLNINFINCSKYGYMLQSITYEGKQMSRFYSGSKIQVKPDCHQGYSIKDMKKVFGLRKIQKYLEVIFTRKIG
jgi:hypothetical protein